LCASLVVFGFDSPCREANGHAKRLIAKGSVATILFGRNVESPDQVKSLCSSMKLEALAHGRKLLVMTDQEGGKVARLTSQESFTDIPSARRIASCEDRKGAVTRIAKVMAAELKAVNVDMDLAPVLDVDSNPKNPVIGDRSYSSSSKDVGELGGAFITSIQEEGVAACAKHFPGHGDTSQDSHVDIPVIKHSRARLLETEIPPFERAIENDVAAIMVGHLLVPELQSPSEVDLGIPASMSKFVVDFLKKDLGFRGAVFIDDMEMGAITKNFSLGEAIVRSLKAGVDMFLVCHSESSQNEAIEAIFRAVKSGEVDPGRFADAVGRVHKLLSYASSPTISLSVVGSPAHREIIKSFLQGK